MNLIFYTSIAITPFIFELSDLEYGYTLIACIICLL